MKKVILLLTLLGAFCSCSNSDENPGQIKRSFYENAELSLSDNAGVYPNWTQGEKTIFKFELIHPDEINISDDELSEIFWIEIPSDLNQFSITERIQGESNIEVYYTRACYCYIPEAFEFSDLIVNGRKTANGQWTITFEMKALGEAGKYELNDEGIYKLDTFDWD